MGSNPTSCIHFWLIAPVSGLISKGICSGCGAVKEFRNWLEDYEFTAAAKPPKGYQPPIAHTNAVRW